MGATGQTGATNGTGGLDCSKLILPKPKTDSADAVGFSGRLIQPRILLSDPSPSGSPEKQSFLEVLAVHDCPEDQECAPRQHADSPPAPGIPADESGRHAQRSERYEGLPGLVGNRTRTTPSLAHGRHAARLPGIERDRQPDERDQHADDQWELLQFHTFPQCKKGAQPEVFSLAGHPTPINLKP